MSDLLAVLAFSWIPFVGALTFSLTAAPLGGVLSLRDEILLGLALPPVGSAAIVAVVFAGVSPDQTLVLYVSAVAAILTVSLLLPKRGSGALSSARWRAGLLASIFCAGEAATILMTALSTHVEAHTRHMLRGELLAIGVEGLIGFVALTIIVLALAVRYRGMLFTLAIDEEGLTLKLGTSGKHALLVFRTISAVLIAAGVIWVGPLLTLGLLAIPTMLWERHARGLSSHLVGVMSIGFIGVLAGFVASILMDVPPVPVVICMLFAIAGAFAVLHR